MRRIVELRSRRYAVISWAHYDPCAGLGVSTRTISSISCSSSCDNAIDDAARASRSAAFSPNYGGYLQISSTMPLPGHSSCRSRLDREHLLLIDCRIADGPRGVFFVATPPYAQRGAATAMAATRSAELAAGRICPRHRIWPGCCADGIQYQRAADRVGRDSVGRTGCRPSKTGRSVQGRWCLDLLRSRHCNILTTL